LDVNNPNPFQNCTLGDSFVHYPPVPSNSPIKPFTENPTSCGQADSVSLHAIYYDHTAFSAEYPWPATTGCDQLSFNPSLFVQPTTQQADSASGADIDLKAPQEVAASVPSPSEIKGAEVTLPSGFSINPNAADGKTSCSDSEARFGTEDEAHCPEFSKVGSVTLTTSLLPEPIHGYVYLGQSTPSNRYRIFLTADGFSVHIKLAGTVNPDPRTGQLTISFENLPETPFEDFNFHIFGSERGLLATPTQCGTYTVASTFTPWDAALPDQHSTQVFNLNSGPDGQPCPAVQRPFKPGLSASVSTNTSGIHSPFSLELHRSDGDQYLAGLTVSTPPGLSATLAGIPYCSDLSLSRASGPSYSGLTEQAFPSCPAASRIGTAVAGAGAGNHPVYLPGQVYLAGPYMGAPLSLAVITPAVSGPYDLGNVVVRVALQVDPIDAHVTAVSDPLPQIIQCIPLRLRFVRINLDRSNFTLNPTNCDPFSVNAIVAGDQGAQANLSYPFQVANCASLTFAPRLALKLTGGVRRLGHPAIHAVVTTKRGEANASSIAVTLPPNELLDNSHINTVCTRIDFAAQSCPPGSMLGHAIVASPLLNHPLSGPAYLRSSGRGLPDLALDLNGQFHIEAIAGIDSVDGGLRATFRTIPDIPLGSVTLDLRGGSKGLIQNSNTLCGSHLSAAVVMRGQNDKVLSRQVALHPACTKPAKHGRHLRHHAGL
jgi:hypothetical protein